MRVALKTGPAAPAVDLAQVKLYANIRDDFNDTRISGELETATNVVEDYTGRRLINQEWYIYYDLPEIENAVELYTFNVTAINEVLIYYWDGTFDVIDPAEYYLLDDKLYFNDTFCLSTTARKLNSMSIEVSTGYAASHNDMPKDLTSALSQLVSYWMDTNSQAASTKDLKIVPIGVKRKLSRYLTRTKGGWL